MSDLATTITPPCESCHFRKQCSDDRLACDMEVAHQRARAGDRKDFNIIEETEKLETDPPSATKYAQAAHFKRLGDQRARQKSAEIQADLETKGWRFSADGVPTSYPTGAAPQSSRQASESDAVRDLREELNLP